MAAGISVARRDCASPSSRGVGTALVRCGRRRRAWSARWRWTAGIAVGANEPIANQAEAFDGCGAAQVINT